VLWRFARGWHGAAGGRIRVGVGPTLATVCSRELLEGCAELAEKQGLTIQTHLSETKGEAVTARAAFGVSFTAHLDEAGLLGPRTVLAHGVWIDEQESELIAARGSTVAHNPISNLKLGAGIAPVVEMRARGCNLALGTDGAASSDNLNLFGPLRLAAILPRALEPDYSCWPRAADVLRMATTGGARAAGLEGELGELRPGLLADLVLLDLGTSGWHPANDLAEQVVFCETGSSVRTVLVGGQAVVRDGRVATVDEAALLAEADEIGRRLAGELERRGELAGRLLPHLRRAYLAVNRAAWPVNRYGSESYRALPTE
jgi:5-methylthioadenosine/S-adenosylhomocysteine deaminase